MISQTEALSRFLVAASRDARIGPTHISLYAALLRLWHEQNFRNPFTITRKILMPISKINGLATYHEKLKDLHQLGYVVYSPNFNSYEGSLIKLNDLLLS